MDGARGRRAAGYRPAAPEGSANLSTPVPPQPPPPIEDDAPLLEACSRAVAAAVARAGPAAVRGAAGPGAVGQAGGARKAK
jgi:hypothetical protein